MVGDQLMTDIRAAHGPIRSSFWSNRWSSMTLIKTQTDRARERRGAKKINFCALRPYSQK